MSEEKINCPFCGEMIDRDATKCTNCKSLFAEPELPGIRFKDIRVFLALLVLTGGLFSIIWFLVNAKPLTKLYKSATDKLKLNWLIILLIIDVAAFCSGLIKLSAAAITIAILIALTYRTLRIIQKYTRDTYDVTPEINPYYVYIFNILYLIHYIDTYKDRVLEVHEHFDIKSPAMITLIIILIAIQIFSIANPNVYEFYNWLLKPIGLG